MVVIVVEVYELHDQEPCRNRGHGEVVGDVCREGLASAHSTVVDRMTVPGTWYWLNSQDPEQLYPMVAESSCYPGIAVAVIVGVHPEALHD